MESLDVSLWNLLGLALVGLTAYMILSRIVLPRFASPWIGKRKRQEAAGRAESLLESDDLDDEERFRLQRCLATLRSHDARRENWAGRAPISDVVEEIDRIWERRGTME